MHRTDAESNLNGRFTAGNPQFGQPATIVDEDWMNAVAEELINTILFAGIALDKSRTTQLREAIVMISAGAVGTGGGNVPTTRQVNGGGMISGGGQLASNLTLTLNAATPAEQLAGLRNDVASTPFSIRNAASASLGPNGFSLAPGGLITQWGQLRGGYAEGNVGVTLRTEFPTNFSALVMTPLNQTGNINRDVFMQWVGRSLADFTALLNYDGSGTNSIDGFDYIALGY